MPEAFCETQRMYNVFMF